MLRILFWVLLFYIVYRISNRAMRPKTPPPQDFSQPPPSNASMQNISDAKFEEIPPEKK